MIKEVDFQKTTENAFLKYAASVAQERAIPDVRDGLKIGLRQGLYAQYSNKLTHKDKFQKAQKSVAAAMAQSYVHGDVAMYDAFIRAARPWSTRYPLEDVQGSYGNPSSPDSHAAQRYVEMRASELSDFLFTGLKKHAVDEWYWNYDDTEEIPSVFPSIGYWNIVNGCQGIAVALATSVPQFNLREVNDALIKIIQNSDVSFDEIYCVPDFATGGILTNSKVVKESLRYGKGESIRIRAKLEYFPDQNMIKATELPYGVFTNTIMEQLSALTSENEDYGIDKAIDHTKKIADIRIYLSKGANPQKMIAKLYKDTSLENWFAVNMIMLDKGRFPKVFGWREACDAYIAHIRACKTNEIQFDLDKALARKNILEGLIRACSIMDEIVALIRASDSPSVAAQALVTTYSFNEEQAKAILGMKLSALTKLDIIKLQDELEELIKKIEWLQHLLNDSTALDEELIKVLREVANKFGDARRTVIMDIAENEDELEEIKEEEIIVSISDNKKLKLFSRDSKKKKPPTSNDVIYTTNLNTLAVFTESGKMYTVDLSKLSFNKDYVISELIKTNDNVLLVIDTPTLNAYHNIITVSKKGYIKKSATSEYQIRARKGTAAAKLDADDMLIGVYLSSDDTNKILIVSSSNYYNCYDIGQLSQIGRITRGVKGIKLDKEETVAFADLIKDDDSTLTTTSRAVKGNKYEGVRKNG